MFMFCWKPILQMRAKDIDFINESHELSDEILNFYIDIKKRYEKLTKGFINNRNKCKSSPKTMKRFLAFYLKGETLMLILLNELFQPSFHETINKKKPLFALLDKLMKIFISADCLRLQFPDVFCQYSLYKLYYSDKMQDLFSESEENKIDVLGCIALPMGRLILSLFSTQKTDIFYPTSLSKRTKINLCTQRKKCLYMIARLMEIHKFKYIALYLGAVYMKFFGKNSFKFDMPMTLIFKEYLELLQAHS